MGLPRLTGFEDRLGHRPLPLRAQRTVGREHLGLDRDRPVPHTGQYSGTTSQGHDLSFQVSNDLTGITNLHFDFDVSCGGYGGGTVTVDWYQPIKIDQADWSFSDAVGEDYPDGSSVRIYFRGSLGTDGTAVGSLQGTFTFGSIVCQSDAVPFTATAAS